MPAGSNAVGNHAVLLPTDVPTILGKLNTAHVTKDPQPDFPAHLGMLWH